MTDSLLTVDLDALAANQAVLRQAAGGAEIAPVVKADGYGLGAGPVARRLLDEGARAFFVARLREGESLRAALGGRAAAIYVLDGATPDSPARLRAADLRPVLSTTEQVAVWAAEGGGAPAALHIDTGMNRLGLAPDEAEVLARSPTVRLDHVMSHLACADEPGHQLNARQLAAFQEVRDLFPDARASLANSAGCFLGPDYAFDMARPGISLYGGGPHGLPDFRLGAVATLEAPVLQIREVPAEETVGYGATFTTERPTRVAILAAGYADGLLRAGSWRKGGGGAAALNGRRLPILGRISMDLIAVDASEVETRPGDYVQLLGPDVPIDEAAAAAGTLAYELLVRLSPRLQRRYIG